MIRTLLALLLFAGCATPQGPVPEPVTAKPAPDLITHQAIDCGVFQAHVIEAKGAVLVASRLRPKGFSTNGGIYDGVPPNSSAHGLLKSDGVTLSPKTSKGMSYFFQTNDGRYGLGSTYPSDAPFVLQTTMPLTNPSWARDQTARFPRTLACADGDRLRLVTISKPVTIFGAAQALLKGGACKTDCGVLVNLDGGPSTQMWRDDVKLDGTARRVDHWLSFRAREGV